MRIERRVASDTVSRPAGVWETAARLQAVAPLDVLELLCRCCAVPGLPGGVPGDAAVAAPPFARKGEWVEMAWGAHRQGLAKAPLSLQSPRGVSGRKICNISAAETRCDGDSPTADS